MCINDDTFIRTYAATDSPSLLAYIYSIVWVWIEKTKTALEIDK